MTGRLWRFLTEMDARAWRAVAVTFLLFGGAGLVLLFGATALGLSGPAAVQRWLSVGAGGPWGLPVAVGGFAAMAFLGVPQFVLIAAAVVAFGPWLGFAYSWVGTLVSALVGFALGRRFGARALGEAVARSRGVERFMALVGRNGLLASLVVRLVPSAPFVVVNMAAGITPMKARDFALGTALGIVPKIALTAFAGEAVVRGLNGGGAGRWIALALAAVVWICAGWFARVWLRRREDRAVAASGGET